MRFLFFYSLLLSGISIIACKDEGDDIKVYDYHAHIHQPSSSDKTLDQTLFIDVEFESHTGEDVEHINIKIFNKNNPSLVVYDKPDNAHVGDVSVYEYQDQFILSAANGLSEGDWVLEAKVWGAEDGADEESEQVEFHIHP